jgi:glycosyltransferase involved in cell wall biosynthesis
MYMRVGLITPRYPPNVEGGGETSAALLAEQLQKQAQIDRVVVFTFDGRKTERRNGVEVRRLRALSPTITEWQNVRAYFEIRNRLDDFDILHAYNMELHPMVGALSSAQLPAVGTLNSYHFLPKSVSEVTPGPVERLYELIGHPTTGRVMMHYLGRIDVFVAISSAVQKIYADHGLDADQIEVVPNMIDPSFSVPERETAADETTTILYVGEISERKGVPDLVRALPKLPSRYELRIVGDGPLIDDLSELIADLGVSNRTMLTGRIDYDWIPEQYAQADLFVHPGVWPEPFGRTIIEAMQAGLPVVCTDVGGPADIVREPELRYPPGDVTALAEAIERAGRVDRDVTEQNREYVRSKFSPQSVASRVIDVYERVR